MEEAKHRTRSRISLVRYDVREEVQILVLPVVCNQVYQIYDQIWEQIDQLYQVDQFYRSTARHRMCYTKKMESWGQ